MNLLKQRPLTSSSALTFYLLIWFSFNLMILTDYPFMHSDEPWLSGLTRQMMAEGRLDVTEPFYDLYERHPHAIKVLYHILQIPFISIFGYSLFAVRLLSLTGGLFCLILLYRLIGTLLPGGKNGWFALLAVIWISWDIQFLYASHTARQEILLCALMLASLLALHRGKGTPNAAAAGLIIGAAAGFHPNAFIIAWPSALYLLGCIIRGRRSFKEGGAFLLSAAAGAGVFICLSFLFNPGFIEDYLNYGRPLGVIDAPDVKLLRLPLFYKKIFNRLGGTYYLPDIRWQFYTLPFLLLLQFLPAARKGIIPAGLIGLNMGILILGKYSQPSFVFLLIFYYLAGVIGLAALWKQTGKRSLLLILVFLIPTFFFTRRQLREELAPSRESYSDYSYKIREHISPDSRVLGSLSLEYLLDRGNLFHWRNLPQLPGESAKGEESPFSAYVRGRDIEYIIVPGEIPYIYETRPTWNVLYGNPALWYPGMERFLREECEMTASFASPAYGTRIAAYRYAREWPVKIYRVMPEDSREE